MSDILLLVLTSVKQLLARGCCSIGLRTNVQLKVAGNEKVNYAAEKLKMFNYIL